ncbi:MAG: HTTM domain-containing protein [Bacteroidota bacterium]
MGIEHGWRSQFTATEPGISLGIYRITFGLLMCFSLGRFMYKGWIESCYLETKFHFTYQYFHWVKPLESPVLMYGLVIVAMVSALFIALGIAYRFWIFTFFLLFTYLELIEKSWYLNHYYFVAIIAFLLCWMPADRRLSMSQLFKKTIPKHVPKLFSNILKLQISLVYFFAGLAKLNGDWLFQGMPLNIWLKAKVDIAWIGNYLAYDEMAYLFSYAGVLYDLSIPFLLWNRRSRPFALVAVVVFHCMTALLFNIGMFPWIMIVGSLIFVTDKEWQHLFSRLKEKASPQYLPAPQQGVPHWLKALFVIHFAIQLILPNRHLLYSENQLWTERHYRFAWNVMLIEKTGHAIFKVKDHPSGKTWVVYPSTHLSTIQEKQMSFQADMIWQYAQFLKSEYQASGLIDFSVYVEDWVAFNGRPSQLYLPLDLDLLDTSEDSIYDFVTPLKQ